MCVYIYIERERDITACWPRAPPRADLNSCNSKALFGSERASIGYKIYWDVPAHTLILTPKHTPATSIITKTIECTSWTHRYTY